MAACVFILFSTGTDLISLANTMAIHPGAGCILNESRDHQSTPDLATNPNYARDAGHIH